MDGNTPQPNNMRRLAAIDIALLGYWLIVAEFAAGVLLAGFLGLFILFRSHSFWPIVLGAYLICIAINYVPLLLYAVSFGSRENARSEMADELTNQRQAMAKYRLQSLFILVPMAVPVLAILQRSSESSRTRMRSS